MSLVRGTFVEASRQQYCEFLEDDWLPAIVSTIRASTLRSYALHIQTYIVPRQQEAAELIAELVAGE